MQEVKISSAQAVLTLFLCRMFTTVTFSPVDSTFTESCSILLGDLISVFVTVIIMLPLFLLINGKNPDIISISSAISQTFGKIVCAYFGIILLLLSVNTIVHFEMFITTAIFPSAASVLIIVTFLVACTYGAFMGLEGIVRAGTIIFVVFLISVSFIVLALWGSLDTVNIKPIVIEPVKSVTAAVITDVSRNLEIILLLVFYPHINGNFTKISLGYVGLSSVFFLLIGTVTVLVLGDFTMKQIFPFYSVTAIAQIGVWKRLDALYMGLWVLLGYVRTTVSLIAATMLIKRLVKSDKKSLVIWINVAVVGVSSVMLCSKLGSATLINSLFETMIPTALGIIILPIVLLIHKRFTAKKEGNVA